MENSSVRASHRRSRSPKSPSRSRSPLPKPGAITRARTTGSEIARSRSPTKQPGIFTKATTSGSERSSGRRRVMTKSEKLCELQSRLKVSKEENALLKEKLEACQGGAAAENDGIDMEENSKFREALYALKRVTVAQEIGLKRMRDKAHCRRREIKERDGYITTLQNKVRTLQRQLQNGSPAQQASVVVENTEEQSESEMLREQLAKLQASHNETLSRLSPSQQASIVVDKEEQSESEMLREQLAKLQSSHNETLAKLSRLEERLQEKESDVERLKQNQRQQGSADENNNTVQQPPRVVGTVQDFEVHRLQKELAMKSEVCTQLEMDLEMTRDELHELKRCRPTTDVTGAFFPPVPKFGQSMSEFGDDSGSTMYASDAESLFEFW